MQSRTEKNENISAHIKQKLSENTVKTFKFISISAGLMVGLTESEREIVAAACASQLSRRYFDMSFVKGNKQRNDYIKSAFKSTLKATLMIGYNDAVAIEIFRSYCDSVVGFDDIVKPALEGKGVLEALVLTKADVYPGLKKCLDDNKAFLHSFPEYKDIKFSAYDKLNSRLEVINDNASHTYWEKYSKYMRIVFMFFLVMLLKDMLTTAFRIAKGQVPVSKASMAALTTPLLMLLIIIKMGIYLSRGLKDRFDKEQSRHDKEAWDKIFNSMSMTMGNRVSPSTKEANYIPIFSAEVCQILGINHYEPIAQTATEEKPEIRQIKPKRRHEMIPEAPVVMPEQAKVSANSINRNNITYYRIYNHRNIPTKDFIGLNQEKLKNTGRITDETLGRFSSLIEENARLVGKVNKNGLVKSEKAKAGMHNYGFYKLKIKSQDIRIHTHRVESLAQNGETITLYEGDTIKKHN